MFCFFKSFFQKEFDMVLRFENTLMVDSIHTRHELKLACLLERDSTVGDWTVDSTVRDWTVDLTVRDWTVDLTVDLTVDSTVD